MVTFDCFGTLIDWKLGQRRVLQALPSLRQHQDRIEEILELREAIEMKMEAGAWMPYAKILALSVAEAVRNSCAVELSERERGAFATGQLGWPAYAESPAELKRLSAHLPLGLLSNCDDAVLRLCARRHLDAPVRSYISAESVRSYKPAPTHWHALLNETGFEAHQVLHVSFTRAYDLEPAARLGFRLGFLRRYQMPTPADIEFAFVAESLQDLVDQVLAEQAD